MAVDMLGNIVWICPLAPGTSADVLIWDGYGPSHTRGGFFDFEVGGHDGAYKGRVHVIVPFIGRKNDTLSARFSSKKKKRNMDSLSRRLKQVNRSDHLIS